SPLFFFHTTAPTQIYPLSLHDALPILKPRCRLEQRGNAHTALDYCIVHLACEPGALDEKHAVSSPGLPGAEPQRSPNQSGQPGGDRKSTRLNSSHVSISYAVFCLKKKK